MYQTAGNNDNKFQVDFVYFPQKSKDIIKIQSQLQQISMKDSSVRSSISNLKKKLNMNDDSFDLSQSISIIQSCRNCQTLKKKIQKLKKQYYPLNEQIKIMGFQNSKINKQKSKLKEKVKQLQEQLDKRKYQAQCQSQKQNRLLVQYKIKDMECAALIKQNKELGNTVQKLRTEIGQLKMEMSISEQVSSQRQSSVNIQLKLKLNNYVDELKDKERQIQNQKKHYEKKLYGQEEQLSKIQQNFNIISQSFQKQLDEKQSVIELISKSLKAQLNNFNQEVKRRQDAQNQLAKLKSQHLKIQEQLSEVISNNHYLKHLINNYESQISQHQKEAHQNQQKLKKLNEKQRNGILQQLNQFKMVMNETERSQEQFGRTIYQLQTRLREQILSKKKVQKQKKQLDESLFKSNLQKQNIVSKLNQLQRQFQSIQRKTHDHKRQLQNKKSAIKQKDTQIENYVRLLEDKHNVVVSLQSTLERHDKESINQKKAIQRQIQAKDTQIKHLNQQLVNMQHKISKMQIQKQEDDKKIVQYQKSKQNQISVKNKLVNQLAQLQDHLYTKSQESQRLKMKIQTIQIKQVAVNKEIDRLTTVNKTQYNSLEQLNRKISALYGQKARLQQKQNILEHQKKVLEKQLDSSNTLIQTLRSVQNAKQDKAKLQLTFKIQDLNHQLNEAKTKITQIQKAKNKQIQLKNDIIQTLNSTLIQHTKQKQQLKQNNLKLQDQIKQMALQVDQKNKSKSTLSISNEDLQKQNKRLQKDIKQKDNEIIQLQNKLQQQKRSYQSLRDQNSRQSNQNIKMLHVIHNLQDQYTKLNTSKQSFIQTIKQENQKLHSQKLQIYAEHEQLKAQIYVHNKNWQSQAITNNVQSFSQSQAVQKLQQTIKKAQVQRQKLQIRLTQVDVYYQEQIKNYQRELTKQNEQINRLTKQLFEDQSVLNSKNFTSGEFVTSFHVSNDQTMKSQRQFFRAPSNIERVQSLIVTEQMQQVSNQEKNKTNLSCERLDNIPLCNSQIHINMGSTYKKKESNEVQQDHQNIQQLKMQIFKLNQNQVQLIQQIEELKINNQNLHLDNVRMFEDNKIFFQERAFRDIQFLRQKQTELSTAHKFIDQLQSKIDEITNQNTNLKKEFQELNEKEELLKIQCINLKIKAEQIEDHIQKQSIEKQQEKQLQNQSTSYLQHQLAERLVQCDLKQFQLKKRQNLLNQQNALVKIKSKELIQIQLKLQQERTNTVQFENMLRIKQQQFNQRQIELLNQKQKQQTKQRKISSKSQEIVQKEASLNQNFINIKLLLQQLQSKGHAIQKIKDAKRKKEQNKTKEKNTDDIQESVEQSIKKISEKVKYFIFVKRQEKQRKKSQKLQKIQHIENSSKQHQESHEYQKKQIQQLQEMFNKMEDPSSPTLKQKQELFDFLLQAVYRETINSEQTKTKTVFQSIRQILNIMKQNVIDDINKDKINLGTILSKIRSALQLQMVIPIAQNNIEVLNLDFERSPKLKLTSSQIKTDRVNTKTKAKLTYSQIHSDRQMQKAFDQKSEQPIEDIIKKKQKSIIMIQDINEAVNLEQQRQESSLHSRSGKNSLKGSVQLEVKNQSLELNSKKEKSQFQTPQKQQQYRDYYSQAPGMGSKLSTQSRKEMEDRYKSNMKNAKLLNKLKTKNKKK